MTLGYFAVALPAVVRFAWVEKICIAGIIFMSINPIDITIFSYTNYRGDIRGIEFGVTDWFLFSLLYSMYFSPRWRSRKISYTMPNSILAWSYFGLCAISIFTAIVPQFAFFGFTRLIRAYLLMWVAFNWIRSTNDLQFIIWCVLGISAYSFVGVLNDKYIKGTFPPRGSFPHQNSLATFQNFMNVIVFAFLIGDRGRLFEKKTLFYWIALGSGTLTTLATLSRGGLATMFVGYFIVFFAVTLLKSRPTVRKKKWKIIGILTGLSIPMLGFLLPPIINRFLNAPKESAEARDIFNEVARELGEQRFFGVGLNNYSYAGVTEYSEVLGLVDAGGLAHHIYWLHYAELGILGPILWTLFMLSFIYFCAKYTLQRKSNTETLFAIGVGTGIFLAMLIGTLEWNFKQTSLCFTYLMFGGFVLSMGRVEKSRMKEERLKKYLLMQQLLSTPKFR